ncbi:MAG: glutamate-5-semialdehyde dehydrogenase [Candidatus Tantalella remota]|nr:glutamate-5-semialdehyde dehydrogenase [Candidatus Tantalella remota]
MDSTIMMNEITARSKRSAERLAVISTDDKNKALIAMAEGLDQAREQIKKANEKDLDVARENGRNKAFIDRLTLGDARIDGMCDMMRNVAELTDPVGEVLETVKRPNGLVIEKVRVPIGVIGIIYEARPNVTADCVSLCLKSGNAVILRGGSDAINSNKAIYKALVAAVEPLGFDGGEFILIEDTSRQLVDSMLVAVDGIDLIMPRGGESLIREVVEKSKVPVIKHYKGICHVYVDPGADLKMATRICLNAKVQRPGVCNAMETMLVHEEVAQEFLPMVAAEMADNGVKIKGCAMTREILGEKIEAVTEEDFATEWLDLVLNVKVVRSFEEALAHISEFGSKHSDAIVTNDEKTAEKFARRVDSASVYINASTRFHDGGEFGKGAEIGISTDKLHARGPMGLKELCSYKYVVRGAGQVRE